MCGVRSFLEGMLDLSVNTPESQDITFEFCPVILDSEMCCLHGLVSTDLDVLEISANIHT